MREPNRAFLGYSDRDLQIASAIRTQLGQLGVHTWMYEYDKLLGDDVWEDIERNLRSSRVVLFLITDNTKAAKGQHREFQLFALAKKTHPDLVQLPLFVTCDESRIPLTCEELQKTNGIKVFPGQYASTAWQIAKAHFPGCLESRNVPWLFPRPGQWLRVTELPPDWDRIGVHLNDHVYFRRISPAGLFECYIPRTQETGWFVPSDLAFSDSDPAELPVRQVPLRYQLRTLFRAEDLGMRELESRCEIDLPAAFHVVSNTS